MRKGEQTRERIVEAAAVLLERQGVLGTGINQILDESGAPRGSLYHHFPGGKDELTCAGLSMAAERWRGGLQEFMRDATSPGDGVRRACQALGARLKKSDYTLGCPIATTTLEASHTSEDIRHVCSTHFSSWEQYLADEFTKGGVSPDDAPLLAGQALAAIEGALVLSRAHKSTRLLRSAGDFIATIVDDAASRHRASLPQSVVDVSAKAPAPKTRNAQRARR